MTKEELFKQLSVCVEKGKADKATPTPPVTQEYCDKIGADFFSLYPQAAAEYLDTL